MSKPRIVVIGGGFGGAFTAKYLKKYLKKSATIELLNAENYFVFQPLLPEVASGTISAPDAVTPLRLMLRGVKFRMANVTHLETKDNKVHFLQGSHRKPQSIQYDHLVLSMGQKTNLSRSPGLAEHSLCMRNLADAHQLRNKIIRRLEHADVTEDSELKSKLLTMVIAGGGFSGVETIGEVKEMIDRTLKYYPNIHPEEVRCVLVQRGPTILPELPTRLGDYAAKKLRQRNIEIMCNTSIVSATGDAAYLDNDSFIPTCLIVTTVGNGPTDFTQSLGIELNRGKIPVTEHLRLPHVDNVWALGDAALVPLSQDEEPPTYAPPTAQFAVKQAQCVAKNIAHSLHQTPLESFAYKPKGSLASIGNYKGVAEVFGLKISGLPAWLLWRLLYIGMLPGFSTRLRVALNWLFDYVLPRSIVQIANREGNGSQFRYYRKGDIVSTPGQYLDGFYSILSGALESRVQAPEQDDFVRILGPGDHWGEKGLTLNSVGACTVVALEDTQVMVIEASEFQALRKSFPALEKYLNSLDEKNYAPELRTDTQITGE